MSQYGPLIDAGDVERAALDTIKIWLNSYLHETEDRKGLDRGFLARPRSFARVNQLNDFEEGQLPAVLVIAPGLSEEPVPDGEGNYRAKWAVAVGTVVSARGSRGGETARDLAQTYGATIRALMVQKGSLGGFATRTEWADERNDNLGVQNQRSIAVSREVFVVEVREVVNRRVGPAEPDPDTDSPHGDFGVAESVEYDLDEEAQ